MDLKHSAYQYLTMFFKYTLWDKCQEENNSKRFFQKR